jgi:drug/metabolite transporter (DMT)-like permease
VFIALIEPAVARSRFQPRELLFGVAAVAGVALVVGGTPSGMRIGMLVGAVSALLAAGFSIWNKRLIEHADALTVTAIEFGGGFALLSAMAPLQASSGPWIPVPNQHDVLLLLVLSTVCTLFPYALSMRALRHMSAYRAQLTVNLEPVYSIVLAVALLHEQRELGVRFYLGVVAIVGAVLAGATSGSAQQRNPIE